MDEWMDGGIVGWMDGWMNGCEQKKQILYIPMVMII